MSDLTEVLGKQQPFPPLDFKFFWASYKSTFQLSITVLVCYWFPLLYLAFEDIYPLI